MPLTQVDYLRKRLGDDYRFDVTDFTADGVQRVFQLPHTHVREDDFELSIDGTPTTTGYSVQYETGTIVFDVEPANEKEISVEYYYSAFSDEELQQFIDEEGSVSLAGVIAVEILMADAARRHDYKLADGDYKESQVFKQLKDLRATFKAHAKEEADEAALAGSNPIVVKRKIRQQGSINARSGMDNRHDERDGRSRLECL